MKNLKLLFILLSTLLIACRKSDNPPLVDVHSTIDILDKSGKSILLEEVEKRINIYNYINGEKIKVYNPDLEAKYGYILIEVGLEGRKLMQIFPIIQKDKMEQTMLIEFADAKVDTLKYVYSRPYPNTVHCVQIFLNKKEVWNTKKNGNDPIHRYIEIIR